MIDVTIYINIFGVFWGLTKNWKIFTVIIFQGNYSEKS